MSLVPHTFRNVLRILATIYIFKVKDEGAFMNANGDKVSIPNIMVHVSDIPVSMKQCEEVA